jgi:protein-arginine kinase activator protein McsA
VCKVCRDREAADKLALKDRARKLKACMAASIKREDYEGAAKIRDELQRVARE